MSSGGTDKMLEHQNSQIAKKFSHDLGAHEQQWGLKIIRDDDGKPIEPQEFEQIWVDDGLGGQKKAGTMWDTYDHQMKAWDIQVQHEDKAREDREDAAQDSWEMGKDKQSYQWDQADKLYKQNQTQVQDQLNLNDAEFEFAKKEEEALLDEKLIEGSYTNLELNSEFYEAIGGKGFEEIAIKQNLQKEESDIEYQGQKITDKATQGSDKLEDTKTQIGLGSIKKQSDHAFSQAGIADSVKDTAIGTEYKLAQLSLEKSIGAQRSDDQQMSIIRNEGSVRAKSAHESQERIIQSLKQQGKSALSQSGRSKAKQQNAIMQEMGRYNAYQADSIVRGEAVAKANIATSRRNQINNVHKAALAESKIEEDVLSTLNKAQRSMNKADSDLSIGKQKDLLDIDSINQEMENLRLNSTVDVKHLQDTFKHAQGKAGIELNKVGFDIENIENNFAISQDQLYTSLTQAVNASASNIEGLGLDKQQADLVAMAKSMLDPSEIDPETGEPYREALNLDKWKPERTPEDELIPTLAPLAPTPPPNPTEGSMVDTSRGVGGMVAGVAGAGITGIATASALQSSTIGMSAGMANPIGAIVGLYMAYEALTG